MSELLADVRRKPELLVPPDNREIGSFTVSLARPMGMKRTTGRRSFIDSVLDTLDDFYGEVVQNLKEWQPPAPKMKRSDDEGDDDNDTQEVTNRMRPRGLEDSESSNEGRREPSTNAPVTSFDRLLPGQGSS